MGFLAKGVGGLETSTMDKDHERSDRISILFVCLGNICRSPLAEGVLKELVAERGLQDRFEIDSAGTGGWHVGEPPDARATMVAESHGVALESRARQAVRADLEQFDYVIAMDRDNLAELERIGAGVEDGAELRLLRDFDPAGEGDVPDPYYGGASGFETVYEMVRRSCEALLDHILAKGS